MHPLYTELKEVHERILKGISLLDSPLTVTTVAGFDLTFRDKKAYCVAVVIDYATFDILEIEQTITDELMPHTTSLLAFREGSPIIETYKKLQHQPDVLLVDGNGALHPYKVGTASYVGVLLNKPCIGIAKDLIHGHLEEDLIIVHNEHRGTAVKTKAYARPIFVSAGHGISLDTSVQIVQHCLKEYKLPYPLHIAHKNLVKLKKENDSEQRTEKQQIVPMETGVIRNQ